MTQPRIAILMGSKSDARVMRHAERILDQFGVAYETRVLSAHRTPEETAQFVRAAEERGFQAFVAGAGFAAHLAGAVAANTILPVIGVPLEASSLQGLDSLLATVQMPRGVPVACMTIGKAGAINAALLCVQMLALADPDLAQRLKDYRAQMRRDILDTES